MSAVKCNAFVFPIYPFWFGTRNSIVLQLNSLTLAYASWFATFSSILPSFIISSGIPSLIKLRIWYSCTLTVLRYCRFWKCTVRKSNISLKFRFQIILSPFGLLFPLTFGKEFFRDVSNNISSCEEDRVF
jgi:hypothetical protein